MKTRLIADMDFTEFKNTLYAGSIMCRLDGRYLPQEKQEVLELFFNIKYNDIHSYLSDRYDITIQYALKRYDEFKLICDSYARYTHKSEKDAVLWLTEEVNNARD